MLGVSQTWGAMLENPALHPLGPFPNGDSESTLVGLSLQVGIASPCLVPQGGQAKLAVTTHRGVALGRNSRTLKAPLSLQPETWSRWVGCVVSGCVCL